MLKLIRGYLNDFEAFGGVGFEIQPFETNGGIQKREIAILNEQQATLLVTYCKNTETVRKFKVALVKAFYEMRAQLQPQCPAKNQLPPPVLTEQQAYTIMSEVAKRAKTCGAHYQTIYRALKARYQVTKYTHIPREMFDDAVRFIRTVELRVPEKVEQVETTENPKAYKVTERFIIRLQSFIYYWRYLFSPDLERFYQLMVSLESPLAPRFWEAINNLNLELIERDLEKLGFSIKELDCYKYLMSQRSA